MSEVKITREEFELDRCAKDASHLWSRIEALNAEWDTRNNVIKNQANAIMRFTAELDRLKSGEGMSEHDFNDAAEKAFWQFDHDKKSFNALSERDCFKNAVGKHLRGLTRRQGFMVDWSKAPEWAIGAMVVFDETGEWGDHLGENDNWMASGRVMPYPSEGGWFDRPAPKKRMKTVEELMVEIVGCGSWKHYALELANGKTIQQLCEEANIPLDTEATQ